MTNRIYECINFGQCSEWVVSFTAVKVLQLNNKPHMKQEE
jgi:hypothetical protein